MVLDHRVPATSAMMTDRVEATEFASVQVRSKRDDQKIAQTLEQGVPGYCCDSYERIRDRGRRRRSNEVRRARFSVAASMAFELIGARP